MVVLQVFHDSKHAAGGCVGQKLKFQRDTIVEQPLEAFTRIETGRSDNCVVELCLFCILLHCMHTVENMLNEEWSKHPTNEKW